MENHSISKGGLRLGRPVYLLGALMTIFLVSVIVVAGCKKPDPGPDPDPTTGPVITDTSWVVPLDVNTQTLDYNTFAWQTFVALNWPADLTYRGKPDMKARIGAGNADGNRPVVWQTWQEQFDIFLEGGTFPGQWNDKHIACGNALGFGDVHLQMFAKNQDTLAAEDIFDEATGQPLIDMDSGFVRYEAKVCESEYQYFLNTGYYNGLQQRTDVHNGKFFPMPKGNDTLSQSLNVWARFGSTEVKAAWRILPPSMPAAQKERYFRMKAILRDTEDKCDQVAEVGLVGLHILRLTPSTGATWFWASFEQVDNIQPLAEYGGQDIRPTFNTNPPTQFASGYSYAPPSVKFGQPLPPANPVLVSAPPFQQLPEGLDSINQAWAQALKGTPFQYYMLIGTVNPSVPQGDSVAIVGTPNSGKVRVSLPPIYVNTSDMANSTMETYVYPLTTTNNCVVCHASGTPQWNAADSAQINGNLQVFTFLFGLAKDSAGVRTN